MQRLFLATLIALAGTTAAAQDPASPNDYKVEIDNTWVRPMHQHPHYVVVSLTELHTTMTLGDGRVVDNPRRPGEIAWRDALQHETENIGDHTAVEIQVEIK